MRWTPKRKYEIARDIIEGGIAIDLACRIYDVSMREITGWIDRSLSGNYRNLMVTKKPRH